MKRLLAFVTLLAAGPAFAAGDIDIVPCGYVTQILREAAAARTSREAPPARAQVVAETREAARRGLLPLGEGDPAADPGQADRKLRAGERAAGARTGGR